MMNVHFEAREEELYIWRANENTFDWGKVLTELFTKSEVMFAIFRCFSTVSSGPKMAASLMTTELIVCANCWILIIL